jgi:predicted Zn-dependent protease
VNTRINWICAAVLLLSLCVLQCTTDYVTGKKTFSLVSESQEIKMGRDADPQIVAEYGSYDDPALQAYVGGIGQEIAQVSHRSSLEYTVRVVDTPIINAFAVPGGYVYITRGILAQFNSEDELAGVMGHEIGHVVARHSAEQMSRAQLAGLGLAVGSVVSETFAKYSQFAGAGVGLLFLSFSRDQESESDLLGVQYSTSLGYDSHGMADFFKTLSAMRDQSGQSLPGFMSTHPDPGDREVRVNQLTEEWQAKSNYRPLNKTRYDYLRRIDGIVYGPDPRQGFEEGGVFYHPELSFQFPVPAGWKVQNSASTVMVIQEDQAAFVQMTLGKAESADGAADQFLKDSGTTIVSRGRQTINGFPTVVVVSDLASKDQALRLASYFVEKKPHVYVFHGVTTQTDYVKYANQLNSVPEGFRGVTDQAILDRKPDRLAIAQAPRTTTVTTALRELGANEDKLDELALLNGMKADDRVEKGYWLKLVK